MVNKIYYTVEMNLSQLTVIRENFLFSQEAKVTKYKKGTNTWSHS